MGLIRTSTRPEPIAYHGRGFAQRGGEQLREQGQQHEAQGGQELGGYHTAAVSDPVYESGRGQVRQQLGKKEKQRDGGDLLQGQGVAAFEGQKQQRREIGRDGLGHKAEIAGQQSFPVFGGSGHDSFLSQRDGRSGELYHAAAGDSTRAFLFRIRASTGPIVQSAGKRQGSLPAVE